MNKIHIEEDIAQLINNKYLHVQTWTNSYKITPIIITEQNKPCIYIIYDTGIDKYYDFINKIHNEGVINIYT
jgi:hypothetical protein